MLARETERRRKKATYQLGVVRPQSFLLHSFILSGFEAHRDVCLVHFLSSQSPDLSHMFSHVGSGSLNHQASKWPWRVLKQRLYPTAVSV